MLGPFYVGEHLVLAHGADLAQGLADPLAISAPGKQPLITHVFVAGDPYLGSDAVFGVKPSLVAELAREGDHARLEYHFVLTSP